MQNRRTINDLENWDQEVPEPDIFDIFFFVQLKKLPLFEQLYLHVFIDLSVKVLDVPMWIVLGPLK